MGVRGVRKQPSRELLMKLYWLLLSLLLLLLLLLMLLLFFVVVAVVVVVAVLDVVALVALIACVVLLQNCSRLCVVDNFGYLTSCNAPLRFLLSLDKTRGTCHLAALWAGKD